MAHVYTPQEYAQQQYAQNHQVNQFGQQTAHPVVYAQTPMQSPVMQQAPQHRAATGVDSSQVTVNPKKRKDGEIDVTELTPCLGYYYLCTVSY